MEVIHYIFGTEDKMNHFHSLANSIHGNIKVDLRYSLSEIEFLDVSVAVKNGKFMTDVYTKPNDKKTYLHYHSDHPETVKKAIPTGLFGRARRICSDEDTFNQQASNIRGRLTQRGYPSHVIDRGYDIARKEDKSQLMKKKTAKKTDSRVPMVITFSKFLPDIKQILQKNSKILNRSERLKKNCFHKIL